VTCISNAGDSGTAPCACNTKFFFDEQTDTCAACHTFCADCPDFGDSTNKSCDSCDTGYFKQPNRLTCLDICPTGYTSNVPGKTCDAPGNATVYLLDASDWNKTFKTVKESVGSKVVMLGASEDYGTDDPVLDIGPQFYFDGSDDFLTIGETAGVSDLVFSNTFVVSIWLMPKAVSGTQALIAKTDTAQTTEKEDKLLIGLSDTHLYLKLTEIDPVDGLTEYEVTGTEAGAELAADTWYLISYVVESKDQYSTDISLITSGILATAAVQTITNQFTEVSTGTATVGCAKDISG
jgi:hypothetical protein